MHICALAIHDLRNLESVQIEAGPGIHWLYGANGSGKTSVLEAIFLLARGRSFRSATLSPVIRDGARQARIVVRTATPEHRLGVQRSAGEWSGRIDGRDCGRVSEFARCLPLVLVDPENHQLLEGPPAQRRSYLDWLMFHVEHGYLENWRRYQRALRQRNAALRDSAGAATLDALEASMAAPAAAVDRCRAEWVAQLAAVLGDVQAEIGFRLPRLELAYRSPAALEGDYLEQWQKNRERDRALAHTRDGPHRADLLVREAGRPVASRFSRGQMKLGALLLRLAALSLQQRRGQTPLLLLDDPVSELDRPHLTALLEWLPRQASQVWVTAVDPEPSVESRMFHVEQGKIQPML
ncbi:MAG: DNA replication/repair protein RecF [Gammaproteobacteria bacterium HGW-Gammaproteobacteria-8]|nr:MAG: DNA replication/repair protein RecF [Gammaproteobacteria bacterium HGW-Gammaproteobacteria-8]